MPSLLRGQLESCGPAGEGLPWGGACSTGYWEGSLGALAAPGDLGMGSPMFSVVLWLLTGHQAMASTEIETRAPGVCWGVGGTTQGRIVFLGPRAGRLR